MGGREGGGGREGRVSEVPDEEGQKGSEKSHVRVALHQVLLVHALFVPCTGQGEGAKTPNSKKCVRHRDEAAARVGAHITLV